MTQSSSGRPEISRGATAGLDVQELRIERVGGPSTHTIVSEISLTVAPGETVGIVGESGSGKSMTAKAITGLLPPKLVASGRVTYHGRDLLPLREKEWRSIRGHEIGLVSQNPFTMLSPVDRCGRIIEESLRREVRKRMSRRERRAEAIRRLAEVGIDDESVVDRHPFQLSGGMQQRVGIAAALAREPRILIADEPSTALDATTQREILALIKSLQEARGMGLILITHDLRIAFSMCDRVNVLYAGSLVETGPAADLEAEPLHPYTHGLLMSEPPADHRVAELVAIPGSVPTPDSVADSCTFAPRCRWVRPECTDGAPPLRVVGDGRLSDCLRIEEIRSELAEERARATGVAVPAVAADHEDKLIAVTEVGKIFHSGGRDVTALQSVSIRVGDGEGVGLVGESGSGKSTLGRIIAGLELPSSGSIEIAGIDASDWPKLSRRDQLALRRQVQMIFQDPYSSLNPMRTIGSTLEETIRVHEPSAKDMERRIAELLRSVGLDPEYAQRKPMALSGGQHQRVAIARALAVRPRVLICDEPVAALDVSVQAQILNLFSSLRDERGIGYLFITHDLSIVRQVVERAYVMSKGRVVESGPVDEVLGNPQDPYTVRLLQSVPNSSAEWLAPGSRAGAGEA
ncbi:dipeptide ABC transporter ATP-binding protein [Amycolatopsis panacis]|uniref:ABC transporter ATP-binding protein n=1 Tax=Amycolatopsis panacis TaxID=2340917 RepID=A0A419IAS1_9PSEU|nr:ABC transporter ATP-binding protein [Amycolatopsis panacis]RJQ91197.1 ABC transporter ATP-binding protein [Amycolatopsis panacis]